MAVAVAEEIKEGLRSALREPELSGVSEALSGRGITRASGAAIVSAVADTGNQKPVLQLKQTLSRSGLDLADGSLERLLLISAALAHVDWVARLPVSDDVKRRFGGAFDLFSQAADSRWESTFTAGESSFLSLCKIATLQRFPAGEWEWEVSGFPRSWLTKIRPRDLPRVALFLGKLRGFAPLFYPHLGVLRRKRIMLVEREINRSYFQLAKSMEMQPAIKGLIASAWFFSPDTYNVSPHLSWLAQLYQENGGMVTTMRSTAEDVGGALSRSRNRKSLHEHGEFQPNLGLVLWPRRDVLRWAARHPEFDG